MEFYVIRRKHEIELNILYNELGFLDESGRVVEFVGSKFWPIWNKRGHTKTRFYDCVCFKEWKEKVGNV